MAVESPYGKCGIPFSDAPWIVGDAYEQYTAFATQNVAYAWQQIEQLSELEFDPISVSVNWAFDDEIYGYLRPADPGGPDLEWTDPGTVENPPNLGVTPATYDEPPAIPAMAPPTFGAHTPPDDLTATAPAGPPTLTPVVVPTAPTLVLPPVPTLTELDIPDAPVLNLPTFSGTRPDTDIDPPLEVFAFTPEEYTSALLDKVRGTVSGMLDGGTGLPAAVAQALRDRAFTAVDAQAMRAEQEVMEDMGARGFSQPNGILLRRLDESRQNNQNQRNALSRDVHIRDQEIAVENLRFAVTSGISLESTLLQAHTQHMQLLLDAAKTSQDVLIAIYNAKVAKIQVDLEVYRTDAAVWLDLLKGELAKLEQFKAEIEAQALIGQLNESAVKVYSERVKAVLAQADIYKAQVDGAKAQADVNESVMRGYAAEITAYAERVRAWGMEWDGFRALIEADATKARVFELVEQGYARRVSTWSEQQNQETEQLRARIAKATMDLQAWQTKLEKNRADLTHEVAKNETEARIYASRIAKYQADAAIETAASDANLRKLNAGIERERGRVDTALKDADIEINQVIQLNQQMIAVQNTIMQTLTQLAASSMSAVNFSAGISSSSGLSVGCSTNYSVSNSDTAA